MALEVQKAKWADDRERDKAAMEFGLKRAEIEARWAGQVIQAAVQAEVTRERNQMGAAADLAKHLLPNGDLMLPQQPAPAAPAPQQPGFPA